MAFDSSSLSRLSPHPQVDETEAQEYAESVGAAHILCSAKTAKNVEGAFLELTKGMLQMGSGVAGADEPSLAGPAATPAAGRQSRNRIDIADDEAPAPSTSCC
jgi:hypothetical protein